jgi:hypothetical protein
MHDRKSSVKKLMKKLKNEKEVRFLARDLWFSG